MVFRNAGFSMNLQNNKLVRLHLPRHITNDIKTLCCFEIRILNYLDRHELTLHATCMWWNRQNYKMYDTQQHRCSEIRGSGTTRVRCSSSEFIRCPWGEPLETDMVIHGVVVLMCLLIDSTKTGRHARNQVSNQHSDRQTDTYIDCTWTPHVILDRLIGMHLMVYWGELFLIYE